MTLAAADATVLAGQLGRIFYFIVLPMLLLAGVGYVNQRRLKLDLRTLTQLNFYFVVPVLIYVSVVTAEITGKDVLTVVGFAIGMLVLNAAVTTLVARLRKIPPDMRNCMLMTTMFHNSGNYGLPLQNLAFRSAGYGELAMSLQAFYMIVQNAGNFTLGVVLAASGKRDRHWKENLLHVVRFPPIYALAAGIITVQVRTWLGPGHATQLAQALRPFWDVILYIRDAFVAIALYTLGAQLAAISREKSDYPIKTSVVLRLLVAPVMGLGLIYLMDLEGFLAQVLLISTTTPTAVNTMLLCLEFDNHPAYAARAVLYSTVLSPLTVTLAIFLAQGEFLARFEMDPSEPTARVVAPAAAPAAWQAAAELDSQGGGAIIARRLEEAERTDHAIRDSAAASAGVGDRRVQVRGDRSGHDGRAASSGTAEYPGAHSSG